MVFVAAITVSLIGDCLHGILGDWKCKGSGLKINWNQYQFCNFAACDAHEPTWHWGWRHWLFMMMGVCLFFIQAVDIVHFIDKKE